MSTAFKAFKTALHVALAVAALTSSGAHAREHDPELVQKIVDLTNAQRRANGLPELRVSGYLAQSAQSHADDQARRNYFAHDTPEGVTPRDRMLAVGYDPQTFVGENIYYYYGDQVGIQPEAAVNWWMNSPGHRANILDPRYTEIGVGLAITTADGKYIYVQNFGSAPVTGNGSWGAIAYSASTGAYGSAKDRSSSAEALAAAMTMCSGVAEDCVLALSYRKGCGVVKRDPATGIWGAGVAGGQGMPAINAAGMQSRLRCVAAGGQECNELVVATCSL
jgi:uncharacterized protein YkwD